LINNSTSRDIGVSTGPNIKELCQHVYLFVCKDPS
jgi:hypothetical protein